MGRDNDSKTTSHQGTGNLQVAKSKTRIFHVAMNFAGTHTLRNLTISVLAVGYQISHRRD